MATRAQTQYNPQPAFEPESFASSPQRQTRGGNGANPRYRRPRSPLLDHQGEVHFYSGSDEPPSPSRASPKRGSAPQRSSGRPSSMAAVDAMQARAKHASLPSHDDARSDARSPAMPRRASVSRRTSASGGAAPAPTGYGGPPPGPGQQIPNGSPRGPSHGGSPRTNAPDGRRSPPLPSQQQQHLSAPALQQASEISRLSSPGINQSVLQPLEKKMKEYRALLADAEADMAQLDDELRILTERRRQAEDRFVDARGRHDDYERQHADVERALRGDFSAAAPGQLASQQTLQRGEPQQVTIQPGPQGRPLGPSQQQSWTMARAPSMDSFDDRPGTGQSLASRQPKKRGNRFGIKLW
ncbi:conserved hypothetical protein [Verticillium alfalfae VaMs.102]|uniref:Uncharacterized protein n=1 Tax=Verticillium alfalfae (strain VaMs.102 / ATCC MYA-4576 / FGSC 10136) TaxID=526221 RepID=C9SY09_VERA1|nr:conserved hypothetical protein [Verticillium alfalfae VaMs.102]EEY23674.1 conserved hypothetical protein [Verticillium alfalfae VaMs.102]